MIDASLMRRMLEDIKRLADRIDVTTTVPELASGLDDACIGYRLKPRVGAVESTGSGYRMTIGPIEDGMVLNPGNPSFWVLSGGGKILASAPLKAEKPLHQGSAWTMPETTITVTDN